MAGILYGVGVGPGDPELMTLKAVNMIKKHSVIALPGEQPKETVAYKIAVQVIPELANKELVPLCMPMTHNRDELMRSHQQSTAVLEAYLDKGIDVVYLVLGDPSVYSTFTYIQMLVESHGYRTEVISGITSFSAAAARVGTSLAKWNEQLHIVPAVHCLKEQLEADGNYVLMKSGKKMKQVKEILAESGREIITVENCGMEQERIYYGVDQIPDSAGYYTLILAKEKICE